jgi:hypothetical protein
MRILVPSVGARFINGPASAYSDSYPLELRGIMSEPDWVDFITRFNHTLVSHWPCDVCYMCGVAFIPCTLGFSLCIPAQCIHEGTTIMYTVPAYDIYYVTNLRLWLIVHIVQVYAEEYLQQYSYKPVYYDQHIVFKLEYSLCNSNLVIQIPDHLVSDPSEYDVEDPLECLLPLVSSGIKKESWAMTPVAVAVALLLWARQYLAMLDN